MPTQPWPPETLEINGERLDWDELCRRVNRISWYHQIDLGHGMVTPGVSTSPPLAESELPDFTDRSVIDIGAWDGYHSFLAERLGARSVLALDHYAWCLNWRARENYWNQCRKEGVLPDLERDQKDFWDATAPHREGFDLARIALNSKVQSRVDDFVTMDLGSLGKFDVTLLLGVLYHVKDPIQVVERLRQVTGEVAVIETESVHVDGYSDAPLLEFYAGDEHGLDFTNWFVTSEAGLHSICRAAGFRRVVTVRGHSFQPIPRRWHVPGFVPARRYYRLAVHAWV